MAIHHATAVHSFILRTVLVLKDGDGITTPNINMKVVNKNTCLALVAVNTRHQGEEPQTSIHENDDKYLWYTLLNPWTHDTSDLEKISERAQMYARDPDTPECRVNPQPGLQKNKKPNALELFRLRDTAVHCVDAQHHTPRVTTFVGTSGGHSRR